MTFLQFAHAVILFAGGVFICIVVLKYIVLFIAQLAHDCRDVLSGKKRWDDDI